MFNVFYYVFINHFSILKAIQNSLNIPSFVFFILYKNELLILYFPTLKISSKDVENYWELTYSRRSSCLDWLRKSSYF